MNSDRDLEYLKELPFFFAKKPILSVSVGFILYETLIGKYILVKMSYEWIKKWLKMAKSLRIFKIQHHILIPHRRINLGGNFQGHSSILDFG